MIKKVEPIDNEPPEITELRGVIRLQTPEVIMQSATLRAQLIKAHTDNGMSFGDAIILVSILLPLLRAQEKK